MNNIKINYFVIVIIALLSIAIIGSHFRLPHGQRIQLNHILSRGELRVSTISSPLFRLNDKKEMTGFDYELTKRFADYLGVKLVIKIRSTINQLFDDLENDDADVITSGLLYNQDRLAQTKTGPSYYSVSQQLIYRKGQKRPRSFADIAGKFVVVTGSAHASTQAKLKKTYPNLAWEESNDYTYDKLLELVAEGKIDYTLEDSITVAFQQRIHPNIAIAFDVSENHPLTWYFSRQQDDSLNAAMLDFFNSLNEGNILAQLEEKYFDHVGSFDYFDTLSFITAINNRLSDYRHLFQKYSDDLDWKLIASIAWQESHWDPLATSPTGVRGIMMLTNPTAQTMNVNDRLDPEESIKGGVGYLQYLMQRLPTSIPDDERIWFALIAYNMGYGHMLDLRKLTDKQGGDPNRWLDVKTRLPLLSKKGYYEQLTYGYARGYEAYQYVENIRRYHQTLTGYLKNQKQKQTDSDNKLITRVHSQDKKLDNINKKSVKQKKIPQNKKEEAALTSTLSSEEDAFFIFPQSVNSLGNYLLSIGDKPRQEETRTNEKKQIPQQSPAKT